MVNMNIEDVPVFRLRVRIDVADVADAGTDDPVHVRFRPGGANFVLDSGNNDFERDAKKVYEIADFNKIGVHAVKDIEEILLGKEGDGGLCVKRISLYVNNSGTPIYTWETNVGHWLDTDEGHHPTMLIKSDTLRRHPSWTVDGNPKLCEIPNAISRQWLERYVEGYVGDWMHSNTTYWAEFEGDHVVSKRKSAHTAAFTLYLAADITGPNPTIDVFFDLHATAANGGLQLSVDNIRSDVDYPLWFNILTLGIGKAIEEAGQHLANNLIRSFTGLGAFLPVPLITKGTFDADGNLELF